MLGTRFLPWTNKVSTCRKALLSHLTDLGMGKPSRVHEMEGGGMPRPMHLSDAAVPGRIVWVMKRYTSVGGVAGEEVIR